MKTLMSAALLRLVAYCAANSDGLSGFEITFRCRKGAKEHTLEFCGGDYDDDRRATQALSFDPPLAPVK